MPNPNQPPKEVRLSCKTCFRYVKDENDLKFHMINEHGQKFSFSSGYRKKSTTESESEDSDSENFTAYENSSSILTPRNKCNECNFEGKNQSGLQVHMNTNTS